MIKKTAQWFFTKLFRIEIKGIENYKLAGNRVLIIANHTSLLDAVLLATFLPEKPIFTINSFIATRWFVKPFLKFIRFFDLDPTKPIMIKQIIKLMKLDDKCLIFPEGRITTTGSLMKVYDGPAMIADKTNATLLPIRIDGAQYSFFSYLSGITKRHLFPKIRITFLPPRKLIIDDSIRGRERRRVAGEKLYQIMNELIFETSNYQQTLFQALLEQVNLHGRRHSIIEDINFKPINFGKLITGSFVLGNKIAKNSAPKEVIGLLLPNANASVVTFFALQAYSRIPAMLNFSMGSKNILSTCRTAQIKQIYTSRAFIDKGKLQHIIDALMSAQIKIYYLEDIAKSISLSDKLKGLVHSYRPLSHYNQMNQATSQDASVILFTSGSEGLPKGVVLSHENLIANARQMAARIDFRAKDIIFNAMPIFHSFGLTGGTLLPILSGIKVFFYPTPLHFRTIPELVYNSNATILFGTDTFLAGYVKYAHAYDFYSIRYVFAGAEKLKEETRKLASEKFGLRIFEGYGTTEAAPVVAANTPMYNRPGTVGQLMPGIDYQLEPVSGIEQGGRLFIKGPNIMKGYLFASDPGVLVPLEHNIYDTGDIVNIDKDGYITILGRAKRFAKIAGEMVSLTAVEAMVQDIWPKNRHAVVAIKDNRKGEGLVLFTDNEQASREPLSQYAKQQGISELSVPKRIEILKQVPLLGTGKIDYVTINEMAEKL